MDFTLCIKRSLILLLLSAFLVGCSSNQSKQIPPNLTGYILEVEDNKLLVAEHISFEEYNQIKNIPNVKLIEEGKLNLLYITYTDVKNLKKGNEIEIWVEYGEVGTSYPGSAIANRVEIIE
ncbi:hypothetical protein JOC85_001847 [Bacillus mesophilus]|uniref:DUF3221 domain-containing protein n=1 Tax=Bacillus mesophilus TaxID=1808955 RepID=A0A6M0Q4X7_9BACI|nr:DUF3221 domain-containing protein [Bacillus mesophilus]MBM7661075.1 hypothetical protein [Bacillus mesophilus]NEY71391.1 DUF3221 domain-containing protein [Bacillus mesophilus]